MKKLLVILAVSLTALAAYGQGGHHPQRPPQKPPQHHAGPQQGPAHHQQGPHDMGRHEVYCNQDWQELWNGRHVRLQGGKVRICKTNGNVLLRGDEVILTHSGEYLVRNSYEWRLYDEDGDRTSVHGEEILCWQGGFYCVRQNGTWRVYDHDRSRVYNVWSNQYIEQLRNGCFLYQRDNRFYVADRHGDRIFNVWGEEVELMQNGLFRCRKNGRFYYYDIDGNERR